MSRAGRYIHRVLPQGRRWACWQRICGWQRPMMPRVCCRMVLIHPLIAGWGRA